MTLNPTRGDSPHLHERTEHYLNIDLLAHLLKDELLQVSRLDCTVPGQGLQYRPPHRVVKDGRLPLLRRHLCVPSKLTIQSWYQLLILVILRIEEDLGGNLRKSVLVHLGILLRGENQEHHGGETLQVHVEPTIIYGELEFFKSKCVETRPLRLFSLRQAWRYRRRALRSSGRGPVADSWESLRSRPGRAHHPISAQQDLEAWLFFTLLRFDNAGLVETSLPCQPAGSNSQTDAATRFLSQSAPWC